MPEDRPPIAELGQLALTFARLEAARKLVEETDDGSPGRRIALDRADALLRQREQVRAAFIAQEQASIEAATGIPQSVRHVRTPSADDIVALTLDGAAAADELVRMLTARREGS